MVFYYGLGLIFTTSAAISVAFKYFIIIFHLVNIIFHMSLLCPYNFEK